MFATDLKSLIQIYNSLRLNERRGGVGEISLSSHLP